LSMRFFLSKNCPNYRNLELSMFKRVGVIGGGQLAWMMGEAAQKLEIELIVQTPSATDPAVSIASHTIFASVTDAIATQELAKHCDVITFENEFVDLKALSQLAVQGVQFYPRLEAIAPIIDKFEQRTYYQKIGVPTPQFLAIDPAIVNPDQWGDLNPFGFPVVLKARRHGYDGYGTFICKDVAEFAAVLQKAEQNWLLEEFVPFERELAVMAARSPSGEIAIYPVVESEQENQVCRRVYITSEPEQDVREQGVRDQAVAIAHTLLTQLNYVGVLGIELFLSADGKVLVNEIAPRVHNSGHYTLDACVTSQFEQHLRAVCDLPLGSVGMTCSAAVMVNLLGFENSESDYAEQRQQLATIPNAHIYWYGKTQSRVGRKLGHVTVLFRHGENRQEAEHLAQTIERIWYPASPI